MLDRRAAAQQQFILSDAAGGVEGLAITPSELIRSHHDLASASAMR
jgi:hypothetical protein